MKSKIWIFVVSLIVMLLWATPSLSAEPNAPSKPGLFLEHETAAQLLADLELCYGWADAYRDQKDMLEEEVVVLKELVLTLEEKAYFLEQDKGILRIEAKEFRKLYEDTDRTLAEERQSRPSRATWFSAGAGGTLLAILLIVIIL